MHKFVYSILVITAVALISCSKDNPADEQGPDPTQFEYQSLVAQDTIMSITDINTIVANATGDGLSFHWSACYGNFIGSGSSVQWTVCHADKFRITCEVRDQYGHSESKDIYVRVRD
jgi:hypothetical protein